MFVIMDTNSYSSPDFCFYQCQGQSSGVMGRVTDRAVVLNLWRWQQSQLAEFSPTRPMSSYVVDSACGTSSSEEFGRLDLERLQNISVYRLSLMVEALSSLPAWHAAVNLVWNQNKGARRTFPLVRSSHPLDICFPLTCLLIKHMLWLLTVIWFCWLTEWDIW